MKRGLSEVRAVMRGATPTHRHLRQRVSGIVVVSIVFDLAASCFANWFETGARGSQIHGYGDALFWTTTQLITVSSQLANPVTVPGRVLDVLLEWYGITVVAALAGSFGSFFHRRGLERDPMPGTPGSTV